MLEAISLGSLPILLVFVQPDMRDSDGLRGRARGSGLRLGCALDASGRASNMYLVQFVPVAGHGTGASANRLALALLALAVAASALLSPAPASADTRHPVQTFEFGSDGTSATKFNVEMKSVTYDQKHNRLYVLVGPTEGEFAKIYGFDNPSSGVFTPRAGFPIKVQWPYWEPMLVVDDSDGPNWRIYFVSKFSSELKAYEPDGTAADFMAGQIPGDALRRRGRLRRQRVGEPGIAEESCSRSPGRTRTRSRNSHSPSRPANSPSTTARATSTSTNRLIPKAAARLTADSDYQGIEGTVRRLQLPRDLQQHHPGLRVRRRHVEAVWWEKVVCQGNRSLRANPLQPLTAPRSRRTEVHRESRKPDPFGRDLQGR